MKWFYVSFRDCFNLFHSVNLSLLQIVNVYFSLSENFRSLHEKAVRVWRKLSFADFTFASSLLAEIGCAMYLRVSKTVWSGSITRRIVSRQKPFRKETKKLSICDKLVFVKHIRFDIIFKDFLNNRKLAGIPKNHFLISIVMN